MTTTYDQFFIDHPEQKAQFKQEYDDFVLSELVLEKMTEKKLSIRTLAKKADVSPTIVQKLRSSNYQSINYRTLMKVMSVLDCRISFTPENKVATTT
jgi:DNA-binding Xre family transcriptional regulator